MLVLFEGVDLSGKSSLIKKLKDELLKDWITRHMSLLDFNPALEIARNTPKDGSEEIGYIYLSALHYDLENYQSQEKNILQDSSILFRSLAYNSASRFNEITKRFEKLIEYHPVFDKIFLFTAKPEERLKRLFKRMNKNEDRVTRNDKLIITNPDFFARMERELVKYLQDFSNPIIIDTSDKNIHEVFDLVKEKLQVLTIINA